MDDSRGVYRQFFVAVFGDGAKIDRLPRIVNEVLDTLTPREQEVIRMRYLSGGFGPPVARRSIADQLGISQERVRQIEVTALRKLRHPTRGRTLSHFCGPWVKP